MPSRDAQPSRPQRGGGAVSGDTQQPNYQTQQQPMQQAPAQRQQEPLNATPQSGADVWDTINDMSTGSGGSGGFDKMNTAFFMKNDEQGRIIFIDENPVIFVGHVIKCISDAGKEFYRTEQCQKVNQTYCTLCDATATNKAVSKANRVIAFRVLDERGKWDSSKKGLDGVPTPKIFLAPTDFAKLVKTLKDEAGGKISDKIIKLQKNTKYIPTVSMVPLPSGGFDYEKFPESIFDGMVLPEILDVYAPMSDQDIIDFIDKFAVKPQQNFNQQNQNNGGNTGGGFQGGGFNGGQQTNTGRNVGGFGGR